MRRRVRWCAGQASVELVLVLPVLLLLVLVAVQVVVVGRRQLLVSHAAREAVRAASVAEGDGPPGTGLRGGLDLDRLEVTVVDEGDGHVRVDVVYVDPTDVALVGALLPDVTLRASAVMRREG